MPWDSKLAEWSQHPVTLALKEELTAHVCSLQDILQNEDNINDIRLTQGLLREAQEVLGMIVNLDINPIEPEEGAVYESDE